MIRTRFLTLLAIVASLTLALTVAACGAGENEGGSQEASDLLDKAFKKTVTSGDLDLNVDAALDGVEDLKGPLKLSITGPYAQDDPKAFPVLDWDIKAEGGGMKLEAGIIVTEDNAFVEYNGETYEVGTELFTQLKEQQESQQQAFTPQGLKALGIDATDWLTNAELEDGEEIGGDATQLITGDVDVERVIKDVFKLLQSPAVRQQLESQGQTVPEIDEPSEADIKKIEDAIDKLELEVNVDEDDYVRRTFLDADFTVPEGEDVGTLKGGSISFDYTLNDVGNKPDIQAPTGAKPIQELLGQFGGLGGGSGAVPPPTTP
ncbi:MAG: hypothetical protein WKF32_04270 [Thermoleophilaceae bacterium]